MIWDTAGAVIRAAFADPSLLTYTYARSGEVVRDISAIRSDLSAPDFAGAGRTLRTVSYEIDQADLLARPVKNDTFTHRGRIWRVDDVTTLDEVGAWSVIVIDAGAAL